MTAAETIEAGRDFIRDIVQADLATAARRKSSPAFRRSRTAILHIGHAKSICLNFGIAQEFGGQLPSALRRHQPDQGRAGIHRRHQARRALARLRLGRASLPRVGLFRAALRLGRAPDPQPATPMWTTSRRTRCAPARHADRAGPEQPVPRPRRWRRTSTCSAACAPASSPTARACCAPRSTWPSGNINLRDPVLYRILHAQPSAHRRRVVHLPDLRFRPRPVRRDRGHHPFALHAGVRGSPAAVRLVDRASAGAVAPAPVRIRPPQPQLHRAVQARADRAGARQAMSPAGTIRACRRWPGCAGAACRRRRCANSSRRIGVARGQQHRRCRACSSTRSATCSTATALRRMAVLRPLKLVIENYPEGQARGTGGGQPSRTIPTPARAQVTLRPRALCRARRLHGEPAEEILPPVARQGGAAALCLFRHLPRGREGRGRRGGRAALHLRSGDPRRQRAGRPQGAGDAALGRRRRRGAGGGAALQSRCSPGPIPDADGDILRRPQPGLAGSADRRLVEPALARQLARRSGAVRAARAISPATRDSAPGRLVFNRTVGLRDTWAKAKGAP